MNWRNAENEPSPEQLAAYADSELDRATRHRVETWLASHPEAAAEFEAQRRLQRLWKASAPTEPVAGAWDSALARIQAGLAGFETRVPRRRRLALGWWAAGVATAAGIVLAILTVAALRPGLPTPQAPSAASEEPLLLASGEDVEIISIAGADVSALVVGEPPLREPLILASADEMAVESLEPEADGMVPYVPRQ